MKSIRIPYQTLTGLAGLAGLTWLPGLTGLAKICLLNEKRNEAAHEKLQKTMAAL